jgi:hypothetical protein
MIKELRGKYNKEKNPGSQTGFFFVVGFMLLI